jgi:hypothetical protein
MGHAGTIAWVSALSFIVWFQVPDGLHAQVIPAGCQANLGYLSGTIPVTSNEKLNALRNSILATDIRDVMRKMSAQNLSIPKALDLLDVQAQVDDSKLMPLEKSIRQAAQLPNDDLMAAIRDRNYGKVAIGDDVLSASIQAYIADDWGAITNRETAKQLRCIASGGTSSSSKEVNPPASDTAPKTTGTETQSSPQQHLPPSNSPANSEPSLAATMQFIQDKLKTPFELSYSVYMPELMGGVSEPYRYSVVNVTADPVHCTLSMTDRLIYDDFVNPHHEDQDVETHFVALTDVAHITMAIQSNTTPAIYLLTFNAAQPSFRTIPVEYLENKKPKKRGHLLAPANTPKAEYKFLDLDLANRVMNAANYAVQLCGGGGRRSTDPF